MHTQTPTNLKATVSALLGSSYKPNLREPGRTRRAPLKPPPPPPFQLLTPALSILSPGPRSFPWHIKLSPREKPRTWAWEGSLKMLRSAVCSSGPIWVGREGVKSAQRSGPHVSSDSACSPANSPPPPPPGGGPGVTVLSGPRRHRRGAQNRNRGERAAHRVARARCPNSSRLTEDGGFVDLAGAQKVRVDVYRR